MLPSDVMFVFEILSWSILSLVRKLVLFEGTR